MAFTSDTTRAWGEEFETLWGEPINKNWGLSEENCDSRYYRGFWVNAVRWLAAGRSSKTNQPVILELSTGYAAPGETIAASVKVRDISLGEVAGATVTFYLGDGISSNAVATARYDPATRAYQGQIPLRQVGAFIVTAVAQGKTNLLGEDRQLLVGETVEREMVDLRARPVLVESIAAAGGGMAHQLTDTEVVGLKT